MLLKKKFIEKKNLNVKKKNCHLNLKFNKLIQINEHAGGV